MLNQYQKDFIQEFYPSMGKNFCLSKLGVKESDLRHFCSVNEIFVIKDENFRNRLIDSRVGRNKGIKRPEHAEKMREVYCSKGFSYLKNTKHGASKTRIYSIWKTMVARIKNEKSCNFIDYGGRGIQICEEWIDFDTFKDWALKNGYSELLSIDRIDVNGNYEPGNCRWTTFKEQARNRRNNTLDYEKVAIIKSMLKEGKGQSEIGRELGISNKVVHSISKGHIWS